MVRVFDSIAIAAVHTGNPDLIPDDCSDLIADYQDLLSSIETSPSSPLSNKYTYYGYDSEGPLPKKLSDVFGCFCEFDIAAEAAQEEMDKALIECTQRRADVLRALARQYIRPIEIDMS